MVLCIACYRRSSHRFRKELHDRNVEATRASQAYWPRTTSRLLDIAECGRSNTVVAPRRDKQFAFRHASVGKLHDEGRGIGEKEHAAKFNGVSVKHKQA